MADRTEHIEYQPPRCPDCGWTLRFRAVGDRWEAFCWNDPKACVTDIVPTRPAVVEVYAREECIYRYCPQASVCKLAESCGYPARTP